MAGQSSITGSSNCEKSMNIYFIVSVDFKKPSETDIYSNMQKCFPTILVGYFRNFTFYLEPLQPNKIIWYG